MNPGIYILLIVSVVLLGLYFNKYPKFPIMERKRYLTEKFSSAATAPEEPSCIRRNADAQALLQIFPQCATDYESPSEDALNRIEFKLILNKLTCLDADVNKNGIPGYETMYLQFNTSHDTEPLTNFVGRCLNSGVRERDVDLVMSKYEVRGNELIAQMSKAMNIDPNNAFNLYRSLLNTTYNVLTYNCIKRQKYLDRPFGPRDPGYQMPHSVATLAPFQENTNI